MSEQSPSTKLQSTWGEFAVKQLATAAQTKLIEAGIAPEKITLESQNFKPRIQLQNTQAITNLTTGMLAGGLMGALIGLSVSLILTDFFNIGLSALNNFQLIHYLAPFLGALVGAVGMSIISGLSGVNVPKSSTELKEETFEKIYSLVVKGTAEQISLAQEIIEQQGGIVERADSQ
jgi:hypothetical protein